MPQSQSVWWFILLAVSANAQHVGARACAKCHPAQYASQSKTGHARSLFKAAEHPLLSSMLSSAWIMRPPKYKFRLQSTPLKFQAHDGVDTMNVPVDWAFGAGDQAVTFVSQIDREWYLEHYLSFYTTLGRMGPTAGHQALKPKTLPEAMGLPYKALDPDMGIQACFECHSTGPVVAAKPSELGVRCEACHGPGTDHKSMANPKRLSATALNEFCGRCHRPPSGALDWNYSWNVRHQPVYLNQSACLKKGEVSCFTCHAPHEPLQKSSAFYNERCVACHASAHPAKMERNCVDCHMPRVSPQPGLRFTNHWIGVYGEGSKLKPR